MQGLVLSCVGLATFVALASTVEGSTQRPTEETYSGCYDDGTCAEISHWDYKYVQSVPATNVLAQPASAPVTSDISYQSSNSYNANQEDTNRNGNINSAVNTNYNYNENINNNINQNMIKNYNGNYNYNNMYNQPSSGAMYPTAIETGAPSSTPNSQAPTIRAPVGSLSKPNFEPGTSNSPKNLGYKMEFNGQNSGTSGRQRRRGGFLGDIIRMPGNIAADFVDSFDPSSLLNSGSGGLRSDSSSRYHSNADSSNRYRNDGVVGQSGHLTFQSRY